VVFCVPGACNDEVEGEEVRGGAFLKQAMLASLVATLGEIIGPRGEANGEGGADFGEAGRGASDDNVAERGEILGKVNICLHVRHWCGILFFSFWYCRSLVIRGGIEWHKGIVPPLVFIMSLNLHKQSVTSRTSTASWALSKTSSKLAPFAEMRTETSLRTSPLTLIS